VHSALTVAVAAVLPNALSAQVGGVWDPVVAWPHVAVHLLHQPDGEILTWAYDGPSARLWDPASGTFAGVPNNNTNIFCSGHAAIAKGGVFVVAGGISTNSTQIFDWVNEKWITGSDMAYDRFYPTLTTLSDGRVLALSGSGGGQDIPEVYDPDADRWDLIPNATFALPLYPFVFLLPNRQLFFSGPATNTYVLDLATESWTFVDSSINDGASAVMLRPGVVMKSGGFSVATKTTEVIDFTNALVPQWVQVGDMAFERHDHNLTLLPDGTVLATGGHDASGVPVLEAELFDPSTGTWTTLAPMQTPRRYHSTAQLLADGRVVSAGGDGFPSAEIFNPPYLFQGPRPRIIEAPLEVTWGQKMKVRATSSPKIKEVTLVRLGAVTHSFDHNQRFLALKFSVAPTTDDVAVVQLGIEVPLSRAIAPTGAYLMFLVSDNGVPSVGHYLFLR
jgi:hypothetical protein